MPETIPARDMTERGFIIYDQFADSYGSDVRVQESSAATAAKVWIFCSKHGFPQESASPHLNLDQAKRVRDALDAFIVEQQETPRPEDLAATD